MKAHLRSLGLTALLALALTPVAMAHTGHAHGTDGFVQGFMHPFTGADHLLTMLVVGFWAATRRGRLLWGLPLTFMSGMALGGVLGMSGVGLPWVESGIAASMIVLGAIVAVASLRVPSVAALALVALAGVFHGHAHGAEMTADTLAGSYMAGMLIATALLHGAGLGAMWLAMRQAWSTRTVRLASAGVAGCGLLMLIGII